jgi:NADPH:quinone reductase-like Zn-dependent oxidoreductase
MRAITYDRGLRHSLKLEDIEKPTAGNDEVLIKVRAASVNAIDFGALNHAAMRRVMSVLSKGKMNRPGRDVAGEIETVGRNITQLKPGDAVFGLCGGAFAEYARTAESSLALKPDNVSFAEAAAVPLAGLTALQGLRDTGKIQPGQKVLINGAAGGVGTFAVQIAKSFGTNVTGVCSTKNLDMVRSIGADRVIDYTREDFTKSDERYDLIFDLVSNHSFAARRRVLASQGMYVAAGMVGLAGSMPALLKCRMTEVVLSRFVSQKFVTLMAKVRREDLISLSELMATGKIRSVIDRRYSLSEVPAAVEYVGEGHARGKVIIDGKSLESGVMRGPTSNVQCSAR